MASGAICDKQISASTQYNNNHAPIQGRLHFQANGKVRGAWSAAINDAHQWLQIYLGSEPIIITGIAIQGRNGFCCQWVTGYNLQYSDDKVNFRYYREEGNTTKVNWTVHQIITDKTRNLPLIGKGKRPYFLDMQFPF